MKTRSNFPDSDDLASATRSTYSSFFSRHEQFLQPDPAQLAQARIKGVSHEDHASGWSLEAGSGAGRFTSVLIRFLGSDARLVCLEPSTAIHAARERFRDSPQVVFVIGDVRRPPFRDRAFRTVVLHGVIAHVPMPAADLFRAMGRTLTPRGTLQVNNSWYPFPGLEKNFNRLRETVFRFESIRKPLAAILAVVSRMSFWRLGRTYPFAILARTFVYAPSRRWRLRYTQYLECLSVPIYNIFMDYGDVIEAFKAAGFGDVRCFPHAVSVKASKGGKRNDPVIDLRSRLAGASVVIVGCGYQSRIAEEALIRRGAKIVAWSRTDRSEPKRRGRPVVSTQELGRMYRDRCFDLAVLASDFYDLPYERVLPLLEEQGLEWNQTVTSLGLVLAADARSDDLFE